MKKSLNYTAKEFDALIKNIQSKKSVPKEQEVHTVVQKEVVTPKKRKGVVAEPIIDALENASYAIEAEKNSLIIAFDGARLFSLNELFALLQYRPYVVFKYKKTLKSKVLQALQSIPKETLPYFNTPCHMTFYRSGSKLIDLDNFSPMFKILLDTLKYDEKKNPLGVIADDNPNIFFSENKIQTIGSHQIAIKIERLNSTLQIVTNTPVSSLFTNNIQWNGKSKAAL